MSRLTRVLVLGAMLGAMSLSVTAIAQAQTTSDDAVQRFRQGDRDSQEKAATSGDAAQRFRQGERDSLAQPTVPVPAAEPSGQPAGLSLPSAYSSLS